MSVRIGAGISKFVLRPLVLGDDDVLDQTQRLIETVLPAIHGQRRTPPTTVNAER